MLQRNGFEVHDVEGWREHYQRTCKLWHDRLLANYSAAIAEVGEVTTRHGLRISRPLRLLSSATAHAFTRRYRRSENTAPRVSTDARRFVPVSWSVLKDQLAHSFLAMLAGGRVAPRLPTVAGAERTPPRHS